MLFNFYISVALVTLPVPPKLVQPQSLDVSGRLNSVLQLHCEIESGSPAPTVIWERDGLTFSRTKSYYTTTESGLFIFNSLKYVRVCLCRRTHEQSVYIEKSYRVVSSVWVPFLHVYFPVWNENSWKNEVTHKENETQTPNCKYQFSSSFSVL